MSRFFLALRAFFAVLGSAQTGAQVAGLLSGAKPSPAPSAPAPAPVAAPAPKKPARSEALTLLAALQRESRLIDLVQEPLDQYTDAQVGAAARDVMRDCGKTLRRLFDLQPLVAAAEGESVEVPAGYDPQRFHLVGNVSASPPVRGRLVHHGWRAGGCQLPVWSGGPESIDVIAPAEVEI